jgi:hypothetical protein
VLESFVTKARDKAAALQFIKKAMKRHGRPRVIVTDGLRSYGAAPKEIGAIDRQEMGRYLNNRVENSHLPFRRRERAMARFRRMKTLQNSARSMPPSTTISPRSAISSAAKSTNRDAPPRWPSGGRSWPRAGLVRPVGFGLAAPDRRQVDFGLTAQPLAPDEAALAGRNRAIGLRASDPSGRQNAAAPLFLRKTTQS